MEIALVFLLAMLSRVMSDTSFKPDIDSSFTVSIDIDGHPLCSLDPPSECISLTQPGSPYPIPLCFLCGWECKKTPNCTGFNLKCDNRTCELYSYQPTAFNHSSDCAYYSVCTNISVNYISTNQQQSQVLLAAFTIQYVWKVPPNIILYILMKVIQS